MLKYNHQMKCGDYMNCYLSERIAVLRRERGLTQEQLGQLVGVSAQAVSKWEKGGAPDVELLPTLADPARGDHRHPVWPGR